MKKHIKNQWKLWQKSFQIPKEEQDFLTKFSFSTSNIYGLPKAHKSKIIQDAMQVQNSEHIKIYEHSDLLALSDANLTMKFFWAHVLRSL